MEIQYIGINADRFTYKIKLNGHVFNYFTGLGWVAWGQSNPDRARYKALSASETDIVRASGPKNAWYRGNISGFCYRRIPTEADVLECLRSDVEAGSYSFQDFCDNFGYSSDSLKALDTYRACMETAQKLHGFTFPEQKDETG